MPDQADKPLRPLLPAPRASQLPPPRPLPASSKKRPTTTKVACNACRSKKKACDGKRPTCTSCAELNVPCIYISANEKETPSMALKRENQALKALFAQLRAMPEDVAIQTLRGINFATDPAAALHIVRPSGSTDPRDFPSRLNSNVEFDLMSRYPVAYPFMRKVSRLTKTESVDLRPSKMPRIMDLSNSASPSSSPSPENTTLSSNLLVDGPLRDLIPDSSTAFPSNESDGFGIIPGPVLPPVYTDRRLKNLDIGFWTAVPIPSDIAANVISLYLETDHSMLGLFDADLFIHDLTNYQTRYCSSLLISALLSFACQAYVTRHPNASSWSQDFQKEADMLWRVDKDDSLTTVTALAFLVQSAGCNGDGELDVQYIKDTAAMAKRLRLFGRPDAYTTMDLSNFSDDEARATIHAAWGVFSTLSMVSQFYLPATTEYPPALPIPGTNRKLDSETTCEHTSSSRDSSVEVSSDSDAIPRNRRKRKSLTTTSEIFAAYCKLWVISSKITWVYQHESARGRSSPAFALTMYNKLLSWAANLSEGMTRSEHCPGHVLICHMWFHGTVLYLFRPYIPIEEQHSIKSWSPSAPAIPAIFAASLEQLKDLVEVYSSYPSAASCIFWHTALMHVSNAAANDTSNPEWRYYFLKCIYAYLGLHRSFTVAGVIARGLLAMAVRKGALGTTEGYVLLQKLREKKSLKLLDGATGLFVTDLDLAVTDREAARVDRLIKQFEELTVLEEFTVGVT